VPRDPAGNAGTVSRPWFCGFCGSPLKLSRFVVCHPAAAQNRCGCLGQPLTRCSLVRRCEAGGRHANQIDTGQKMRHKKLTRRVRDCRPGDPALRIRGGDCRVDEHGLRWVDDSAQNAPSIGLRSKADSPEELLTSDRRIAPGRLAESGNPSAHPSRAKMVPHLLRSGRWEEHLNVRRVVAVAPRRCRCDRFREVHGRSESVSGPLQAP
jgi:hypothetical protein